MKRDTGTHCFKNVYKCTGDIKKDSGMKNPKSRY